MRKIFRSFVFMLALFIAGVFGISFFVNAAALTSMSDEVSDHTISTASDHTVEFTTPTGVESSSDTITLDFASFDLSSVGVSDIDFTHGPTTGSEVSETLASSASAGVWGVNISGTTITFTAPTDAGAGEIDASDVIRVLIGTIASGGSNQIVNPSSAGQYLLTLAGTFGDTGDIGLAVLDDGSVSVTATYPVPSGEGEGGPSRDVVAPTIYNVSSSSTSETSVLIIWTTDEYANSEIDFGHAYPYASGTVSNANFVIDHTLLLESLVPCQTYEYIIHSTDPYSNERISFDHTFTTPCDETAPVISDIQTNTITDSSAIVSWQTSEPATTIIEFGISDISEHIISIPGYTNAHQVSLIGLLSNQIYQYRVRAIDVSGNESVSDILFFETVGDTTPPTNVFFTAEGLDGQIRLSWSAPIEDGVAGVRVMRRSDRYPGNPFDGDFIYQGNDRSFIDSSVVNGIRYYYGIYVFDASGNFSSGSLASAVPTSVTTPEEPPVEPPTEPPVEPGEPGTDIPGTPGTGPGGEVIPPTIPVEPTPGATVTAEFFGAFGSLPLSRSADGTIGVRGNTSITVRAPVSSMNGSPTMVVLQVEDFLFVLQYNEDARAYEATFSLPPFGLYDIRLQAYFDDGRVAEDRVWMRGLSFGSVLQRPLFGEGTIPVEGAEVYLYQLLNNEWVLWNGERYGQSNPYIIPSNGQYIFEIEPGEYYAEIRKEGFETYSTDPAYIDTNVFNQKIELIAVPKTIEDIDQEQPIFHQIQESAEILFEQAGHGIIKLREWLERDSVQRVNTHVVGPATVGIALANTGLFGGNLATIFTYLRYLFGQPVLLLWRRKKKKYGVVYHSLTKRPVDLAVVHLIDVQTGLTIQSQVTDRYGRYVFHAEPGEYRLSVHKKTFVSPSALLQHQANDVEYPGIYTGQVLTHGEDGFLAPHIPIDPTVPSVTPRKIRIKTGLRHLQDAIAVIGFSASGLVFLVSPSVAMGGLVIAHALIYSLFRRISAPLPPKDSWGYIYDQKTKKPISHAIIRLFDAKYHRLLDTQLTNQKGRFGFLAGSNTYEITIEAKGYRKAVVNDLISEGGTDGTVSCDVALSKQ